MAALGRGSDRDALDPRSANLGAVFDCPGRIVDRTSTAMAAATLDWHVVLVRGGEIRRDPLKAACRLAIRQRLMFDGRAGACLLL